LQKNELSGLLEKEHLNLALFIIFTGRELPDFTLVTAKMSISLQRLINLVNEKVSSGT
jgi:hypothetical protein